MNDEGHVLRRGNAQTLQTSADRVSYFKIASHFAGAHMTLSRFGLIAALLLALGVSYRSYDASIFLSRELTVAAQTPPPTPKPTPVEDTTRYVAWMEKQGKPIADKPHEDVSLRIGDWGFFYHGDRPVGSWTPLQDRVGLDRSGHAVTQAENCDWYLFLSTDGLAAAEALKRIAWLFNAGPLDPATAPRGNSGKITAPALTTSGRSITFSGWWQAYSDPPYSRRITITATAASSKLVIDH